MHMCTKQNEYEERKKNHENLNNRINKFCVFLYLSDFCRQIHVQKNRL